MSARRETEVQVFLPNGNRGLPALTALLQDHNLQTWTLSCRAERQGMAVLLTGNRSDKILEVLRSAGYECHANPVVLLGPAPYQPGVAAHVWMSLREGGIQVLYSYLASSPGDQCFLIFRTSDDERALQLIHDDELTALPPSVP